MACNLSSTFVRESKGWTRDGVGCELRARAGWILHISARVFSNESGIFEKKTLNKCKEKSHEKSPKI